MASPAQIAANRRNAQLSTGPTSPTGKAVSRFNGLKSGIDAKSQVIPCEDPAELAALAANYQQQFRPATPAEVFLVDAIVSADWELRRLRRIEAQLWEWDLMVGGDAVPSDRLTRLHRRIDATERSYYRALKQLESQIASRSGTQPEEAPAEDIPAAGAAATAETPQLGSVLHFAAAHAETPHPMAAAEGISPQSPAPIRAEMKI
jgi:hypothetical protein